MLVAEELLSEVWWLKECREWAGVPKGTSRWHINAASPQRPQPMALVILEHIPVMFKAKASQAPPQAQIISL